MGLFVLRSVGGPVSREEGEAIRASLRAVLPGECIAPLVKVYNSDTFAVVCPIQDSASEPTGRNPDLYVLEDEGYLAQVAVNKGVVNKLGIGLAEWCQTRGLKGSTARLALCIPNRDYHAHIAAVQGVRDAFSGWVQTILMDDGCIATLLSTRFVDPISIERIEVINDLLHGDHEMSIFLRAFDDELLPSVFKGHAAPKEYLGFGSPFSGGGPGIFKGVRCLSTNPNQGRDPPNEIDGTDLSDATFRLERLGIRQDVRSPLKNVSRLLQMRARL